MRQLKMAISWECSESHMGKVRNPDPGHPFCFSMGLKDGCSTNFLDNYAPSQSLGFYLADAGFDVWLANSRGNSYSKNNVRIPNYANDFWKFRQSEQSGNGQIYYLGHSQGTLIGFAEFSQNPETARKIKKFFAMAPVAHLGHVTCCMKVVALFSSEIDIMMEWMGMTEFKPSKGLIDQMTKFSCSKSGDKYAYMCSNLEFLLYGHNATLWNNTRIPVYMCHNPDSTSSRNMAHFGQMVNTNKMQMYDYGPFLDIIHYGSYKPPVYDPSKMTVPTVFFTGTSDKLADPTDVQWLIDQFSGTNTLEAVYKIPYYGHLDFIFALNAPEKVYQRVVDHMHD